MIIMRIKRQLALIVMIVIIITVPSTAQTIDVTFDDIKVFVNGEKIDKETLLFNGTTYMPIRAVAEAIGLNVDYDDETKSAYISESLDIEKYKKFLTI